MRHSEFLELMPPKPDQRLMIVGASGTGKTTLARCILRKYPSVLVIDPKCTYGGRTGEEGYTLVRTPLQLRLLSSGHKRIQFRPNENHQNIRSYDEVYRWAYRHHDILVYTDEVYLVMNRTVPPQFLTACVTCGRELGVGMINGSQRPSGVDKRIYTESNDFAAFRLRYSNDIKSMSEVMGDSVFSQPSGYGFWYYKEGWDNPRMFELKLGGSV